MKGKEHGQQQPPISNGKSDYFPQNLGVLQWVGRQYHCPGAHRLAACWYWDKRKRKWYMKSKKLFYPAGMPKSATPYCCTDPSTQFSFATIPQAS